MNERPGYVEPEQWAMLVDFESPLPPELVPQTTVLRAAYDGKTVPPEWQPLYDELLRKMNLPRQWVELKGWPGRPGVHTIWEFNALMNKDAQPNDWPIPDQIRMVAFLGGGDTVVDPLFRWTWRTRLLARWCQIKRAVLNVVSPELPAGKDLERKS
jgi:hypothetical protein